MGNIAIITARSGSKGLKDKNIRLLNGMPLIEYSIKAAIESKQFDEVMVSTDSTEYADIARKCGAKVPFLRSAVTSSDTAGSWDVVREVLNNYNDNGKRFDSVCLLQPTSPLRTSNNIVEAYSELKAKQADAITGVCEVDHSPVWTMMLQEDLSLSEYRASSKDIPRQLLGQYYRVNGAIYIRKINYCVDGAQVVDTNEYAYIMSKANSVDIDTIDDFEYAEYLINRNACK